MTTMRAAATGTTVVVNLYPIFPLAMARLGAAKLKERDGMEEEGDYMEAFNVGDNFTLNVSHGHSLTNPSRLNLSEKNTNRMSCCCLHCCLPSSSVLS